MRTNFTDFKLDFCSPFFFVLQICVAARLCQSVVIGLYSHSLDPENDYLLVTQENGWKMLKLLRETPKNEVEELWFTTADEYLKQSDKR